MPSRCLPVLLLLPALMAQAPVPRSPAVSAGDGPLQLSERLVVDSYQEARSRSLFATCDEDGDGALDLFDAAAALETVGSTRDIERFRRLDLDRDGFLGFDEFDRHYREVIRHGESLRLRLASPEVPTAPDPKGVEQQLLQLFDADRSGDFSVAEAKTLLLAGNVPADMRALVEKIDPKLPKRFTVRELLPLLQDRRIPGIEAPIQATTPVSPLPSPYAAWDKNADGAIDETELANALRSYDLHLARWTKTLLRAADRDRDGKLTAEELRPMAAPATQAVVGSPARR